jgi:phospholipid/cholesterol/gamma-HCH transport system substrate-binding protein
MNLYYKQELTVGALVLVALAVFLGGLLWLTGKSFTSRGKVVVPVQFAVISGLTAGDPVQISGVNVGRVTRVELQEVGRAIVRIEVDGRFRPREDAQAEIGSLGFLGDKYVLYAPGEDEEFLPDDAVIVGREETALASSAAQLAEEAGEVLRRSQGLLSDSMTMQVQQTLAAAERALDVVARVGSGPVVETATQTLVSLQGAARSLDSLLGNPALNESISQMDEIAESVQEMTEGLAAVTQNLAMMLELMQSPDGSVGRALTDTTLHTDVHELLVSMRLLLDDIRERPGRYVNVTVF